MEKIPNSCFWPQIFLQTFLKFSAAAFALRSIPDFIIQIPLAGDFAVLQSVRPSPYLPGNRFRQ